MDNIEEIYEQIDEDHVHEVRARKFASEGSYFSKYMAQMEERIVNSGDIKAKNYLEELTLPYLNNFNWPSDETFFKCWDGFWTAAAIYFNKKTPAEYKRLLEWTNGKNLHPRQAVAMFYRATKRTYQQAFPQQKEYNVNRVN